MKVLGGAARAMIGILVATAAMACTSSSRASSSSPCPPNQRQTLLDTALRRLVLSAPFELPAGRRAFASTTNEADQDSPFGGLGGIGSVSVIANGRQPNLSTTPQGDVLPNDPTVTFHSTGRWWALPVGSGSWQLYTAVPGANLAVTVISCPG